MWTFFAGKSESRINSLQVLGLMESKNKAYHILFCDYISWPQFLLFNQGVFRDLIEKVVNEVGGSIWELEQGFALA